MRPRSGGVLAIDDTFNEKYGEHFEKIGYFYLPAKKKYGFAHNLVTLHYADSVCDYPLEFRLYEQMDVDEAVELLKKHGGKFKPEVLARKKSESAKRSYLGPKVRAIAELGERFPTKIQLACRLVIGRLNTDSLSLLYSIAGTRARSCASTSAATAWSG